MTLNFTNTLRLDEQVMLTTLLTQPHRTYHNINHINDSLASMYDYFNAAPSHVINYHNFNSVQTLTYAIWYHDVIYNPYAPAGLNEAQSANLFFIQHSNGYSISQSDYHSDWLSVVYDIILKTAHHTEIQSFGSGESAMAIKQAMLDIDLAGLGKSWKVFTKNSLDIRKEYYNTPDMDVIRGRLKFFQKLNQRDTFYYTEYFRDLYHTSSKTNVGLEIEALENAIRLNDSSVYFQALTTNATF